MSAQCFMALTGTNTECLVQSAPGRYLRMQLVLKTNSLVSPVLSAVQVGFPRSSIRGARRGASMHALARCLMIGRAVYDG